MSNAVSYGNGLKRWRSGYIAVSSWTGTVTVVKGTGTLAQASGKKGVLKCSSGDSVHLTCTEKLKLKTL